MGKQQDVIRTFVSALCNTNKTDKEALDEAIRACSSFNNTDEVIAGILNARNAHGYSFLKTYCGIDLGNSDDGAITGSDAEGGSTKTQDSVITEYGNLDESFCGNEFTTQSGLTVKLGDGLSFYSLTSDQQFIWRCLKTWWIEGATTLIKDSYGDYFNVQGMTLEVEFKSDSANASGWGAASYGLSNGFLHLEINKDKYSNMNKSNYNGTTYSGAPYLDRLIAHELTHAITGAKGIAYGMPQFITEGLAELTRGIDNQYKAKITSLANGTESLSKWLNVSDKSTGNWYAYAAGYIFLRYLAKQGATTHQSSTLFTNGDDDQRNTESWKVVNGFGGNDYINNTASNVTMIGGEGNDTLDNWYGHQNVKMYGENGNDYFKNSGSYVTMDGGEGNDEIHNYEAGQLVSINSGTGDDYIDNNGSTVTIDTGDGDDYIWNYQTKNVKIESGNGNDEIVNVSYNSMVYGGDGNDSIYNGDNDSKIYGGNGNDSIWNWQGNNTRIELGDGNDSVTNWHGNNATIDGGNGDDFIHNNDSSYSSINAGEDNDTIRNESSQRVTINGGLGNDLISIDGSSAYSVIQYAYGNGKDTVYGVSSGDTLQITDSFYSTLANGNDLFVNVGNDADNLILLKGAANSGVNFEGYYYAYGRDINRSNSYNTLCGNDGNDTIVNWGEHTTILTGKGNDYVYNGVYENLAGHYNEIYTGTGDDEIYNNGSYSYLIGGSGNDYIHTHNTNKVTVHAGEGDDTIQFDNSQNNLMYYMAGDGNDIVWGITVTDTLDITGDGKYSSIQSDNDKIIQVGSESITFKDAVNVNFKVDGIFIPNDNDPKYVSNSSSGLVIKTGSANDTVDNSGDEVNISVGAGNDSIYSDNVNQVTIYAGEGSDTVTGNYYNSKIYGGTGNDYIDIIDNDFYKFSDSQIIMLSKYVNVQSNLGNDLLNTIDGGDGDDTINVVGFGAGSIYGGNGNDSIYLLGSFTKNRTVTGGQGNDTIYVGKDQYHDLYGIHYEYYNGDGNDIIYGFNHYTDELKINGSSYTTIQSGNDIKVNVNNGSILIKDVADKNLKIDGTYDDSFITTSGGIGGEYGSGVDTWEISGTTATYGTSANTLITISGLKYNAPISGIKLNGNVITLSDSVLNKGTVTVSNGYTLKLADDVTKMSATSSGWSISCTTATYKENIISAGYSLSSDSKTINYNNASGGNTLVTVSGLKSNAPVSGISLNGSVVTIYNSVLNQGTVNVSNGYTLKLANDVPKTSTTSAAWSVSGTTATYKANSTSAGYSLSSDSKTINYTNASVGNTLVTVSGLKSNAPVSGISLNGNTVTLSNSVLNQGTVSVSNGYTLKLANDVPKTSTTSAAWSVSGTTATYKANATSAGYSLSSDGKTINYNSAGGGNTLVTVSGLKSNAPVSGISLNGSVVILSNSVLNQGKVTVSNGYTLKLANDVPKTSTTSAAWSVSGTTATYKANATSAGYSLSSDGKTISYNSAGGGNTLVTVSGLKSNAPVSGISLSGSVVTLSNSVLNQGNVTVSNGYTLKLANDVPKTSTTSAAWSVSGTTATYKANATSAGYSLSSDGKTINYNSAGGGNSLVTVSGLKSNAPVSGISLSGSIVTLSNSVLNQGKVTVSNGYTLKLANDVPKTSTTSAAWSVSGTTATYKANATSAGYSLSSDGKTINYNNAGGGNTLVTISGLKNGVSAKNGTIDGISIKNDVVSVSSSIIDPNKIKITGSGYKIEILTVDPIPNGISIKNNVLTASDKFKEDTININSEWANSVTKVNASAISHNLSIVGNTTNNSIKGGKSEDTINGGDGKDTLFGGNGNDKLYGDADNDVLKGDAGNDSLYGGTGNDTLTGGAGNDVFIFESGNDVITDYKPNEDKIQMNPSAITSSTLKGSEVILTTNDGTLTIKSVKDKVVTFVDDKGKTTERIFFADTSYAPLETGLTYDSKRIVLTANNKFTGSTINLGNYLSTVTKVNASATSQALNIVGNSSDNSIKSGKDSDTINGGTGKDTIFGGTGNDSIYGGNDNDKLQGDIGNDTLNGGRGNDTLIGGAGNDVFVYESGNDVITDYKANEDKIKLNLSTITSSSVKGSDVILKTNNGNLTVKATKDKVITFIDNNGKTTEKIFFADTSYAPLETGLTYDAKRTVLTAKSQFTGTEIDLGEYLETVTKVNFSAISQDVNVIGNSADNSIKAGKGSDTILGGNGKDTIFGSAGNDSIYGGNDDDKLQGDAGNDTLNGGRGNDTLIGGAGNDVFIFEGGNDVITDYKAGEDKIKISSGTISKTTYKNKDVVFTVASGSLTVKNAKGKEISFTNGSQTQTYSQTFDLLYDCNFMTEELQIDDVSEVTANNYSVGQIQSVSDGDIFDKATLVSDSSFNKK